MDHQSRKPRFEDVSDHSRRSGWLGADTDDRVLQTLDKPPFSGTYTIRQYDQRDDVPERPQLAEGAYYVMSNPVVKNSFNAAPKARPDSPASDPREDSEPEEVSPNYVIWNQTIMRTLRDATVSSEEIFGTRQRTQLSIA